MTTHYPLRERLVKIVQSLDADHFAMNFLMRKNWKVKKRTTTDMRILLNAISIFDVCVGLVYVPWSIHTNENNGTRQKPTDLGYKMIFQSACLEKYERAYHAKEVSGNAKHIQKSTEGAVFGFCEATIHCLNFSTQSKLAPFAMKIQLVEREAEEIKQAKMTNVRR